MTRPPSRPLAYRKPVSRFSYPLAQDVLQRKAHRVPEPSRVPRSTHIQRSYENRPQTTRWWSLLLCCVLMGAAWSAEARGVLLVGPGALSRATSPKYRMLRDMAPELRREVRVLDFLQRDGVGLSGWTASRELVQMVEAVAKARRAGFKHIAIAGFSLGGWAALATSSAKVPQSPMREHLEQQLWHYHGAELTRDYLREFDRAHLDRLVVGNPVVDVSSALRALFVPSNLTARLPPWLKHMVEVPLALPISVLRAGWCCPIPTPGTKIRLRSLHKLRFEMLSPQLARDADRLPALAPAHDVPVLAFCAQQDERVPQGPMVELARSHRNINVVTIEGVGHAMRGKERDLLQQALPFLQHGRLP